MQIPNKIKVFMWRATHEAIIVKQRVPNKQPICSICTKCEESVLHRLVLCENTNIYIYIRLVLCENTKKKYIYIFGIGFWVIYLSRPSALHLLCFGSHIGWVSNGTQKRKKVQFISHIAILA